MSTDFSQEDDQSGAEIARVALQLAHLVNTSGTDRSTKVLSCRLLAKIGKDVQEKAIDRDNQDSQGLDDNILEGARRVARWRRSLAISLASLAFVTASVVWSGLLLWNASAFASSTNAGLMSAMVLGLLGQLAAVVVSYRELTLAIDKLGEKQHDRRVFTIEQQ
ncbi:hypothetical protein [Amycolatopsis sp. CA-230715]|uniref:hypothetical protein n=1 Tax=Amycolatopsis sp. CA-230715 TaxID=2745196 RepID=UPI001C02F47A|nr:hypothetical protein [Amycolatopsis sp. CA-230715]